MPIVLHEPRIQAVVETAIAARAQADVLGKTEQEEAKEELEIDYAGDTIEIGFNVTYLMDALNNIDHDMVKLELQDGNSSALITVPEQPGFKYVVMPMRI